MGVGNFGWHILRKISNQRLSLGQTLLIGNQSDYRQFKNNRNYGCSIKGPLLTSGIASSVDILDVSNYQDANIIADLSKPLKLNKKFDTIVDFGTIEHVFDIKRCLYNYLNLLNVGGSLIVAAPCNNFSGHGFYQLSPEFFYTILELSGICKDVNCYAVESPIYFTHPNPRAWRLPKPYELNKRVNIISRFPINIMCTATRIAAILPDYDSFNPIQSDYLKNLEPQALSDYSEKPCIKTSNKGLNYAVYEKLPISLRKKISSCLGAKRALINGGFFTRYIYKVEH